MLPMRRKRIVGAAVAARGGGSAYDTDAAAYFAAMTVQPDATRKGLINALIVGLKADGVWAQTDHLYLLAGHHEQASRINACRPGVYDLALSTNEPTFTTDRGWTANPASDASWLGGYIGSVTERRSSQDFRAIYGYINASAIPTASAPRATFAILDSTGNAGDEISPLTASGLRGRLSSSLTVATTGSPTSRLGGRGFARNDAANVIPYVDGASLTTVNRSSIAVSRTTIRVGGEERRDRSAFFWFGGYLDATQMAALHARVVTYLTAIGAN